MVEYENDGNTALIDGIRFNRDEKTGYYLSSRKTDIGKRERLHTYVWRKNNGIIPKGYHIHHIDENKHNNEITNLVCIPAGNHESLHRSEYAKAHKSEILENLEKNATPRAKEWHKSQAGHLWHKKHGKEVFGNLKIVDMVCEYCGKPYKTRENTKNTSRYCSNNCKMAARRKSGIDNEKRKCKFCGKTFIVNKYSKTVSCSRSCAAKRGGTL